MLLRIRRFQGLRYTNIQTGVAVDTKVCPSHPWAGHDGRAIACRIPTRSLQPERTLSTSQLSPTRCGIELSCPSSEGYPGHLEPTSGGNPESGLRLARFPGLIVGHRPHRAHDPVLPTPVTSSSVIGLKLGIPSFHHCASVVRPFCNSPPMERWRRLRESSVSDFLAITPHVRHSPGHMPRVTATVTPVLRENHRTRMLTPPLVLPVCSRTTGCPHALVRACGRRNPPRRYNCASTPCY